jgi:hypothetical protein
LVGISSREGKKNKQQHLMAQGSSVV